MDSSLGGPSHRHVTQVFFKVLRYILGSRKEERKVDKSRIWKDGVSGRGEPQCSAVGCKDRSTGPSFFPPIKKINSRSLGQTRLEGVHSNRP